MTYAGPGNPTHGIASTYRSPLYACRCRPCTDANTARQRDEDASRKTRLADDPSLAPHGIASTYINWSCRCDPCRAAHKVKLDLAQADREARLRIDPNIRQHGLQTTYNGWGCRCDACSAANSSYQRRVRENRT